MTHDKLLMACVQGLRVSSHVELGSSIKDGLALRIIRIAMVGPHCPHPASDFEGANIEQVRYPWIHVYMHGYVKDQSVDISIDTFMNMCMDISIDISTDISIDV